MFLKMRFGSHWWQTSKSSKRDAKEAKRLIIAEAGPTCQGEGRRGKWWRDRTPGAGGTPCRSSLVFRTLRKTSDLARASVAQGTQMRGWKSVEWPVSECQGDVSAPCCPLWGRLAAQEAGLEPDASCCSGLINWTGEQRRRPLLSSPAFFPPSSACCWQNLPGGRLARESEQGNLQF